jgi:hypothetical protein
VAQWVKEMSPNVVWALEYLLSVFSTGRIRIDDQIHASLARESSLKISQVGLLARNYV